MAANITPLQAFSLGADSIYLSRRRLPSSPDGHYDWENQADPDMSPQTHSGITNLVNSIETMKARGSILPDAKAVSAVIQAALHPEALDDRTGAFADALDLLFRLPPQSEAALKLGDVAIKTLYNTLPHPRASLLGPVHAFRQADGGNNNLHIPDLGRAGTPYARSVQGKWCYAPASLPDPGLVFDTLFKARDERKIHPGGNSSFTFAFATIVIHSLFRTDPKDWSINGTSSYLDLSPLYGINQETQDLVRDKEEGRGLLYPDVFSEERLSFLPPAASVILVLFSRNHNYIAEMLLKINERKRWTDPPPVDAAKRAQQDEEIFQTAKLVNCGHFMSLIMGDYVAGFLGLAEGGGWKMNPFDTIKIDGAELERGQGNHCSVEFNVLYRWHPTLSIEDEKWTEDVFSRAFNNKPFDQLTMQDFGMAFGRMMASVDKDPRKRSFAGLQRNSDGRFSDDALAKILLDATASPAGAYGPRNTPACLRIVEILGILQARQWGVCTMNEFRKFLSLKQFTDFEEWSSDAGVVDAARRLYGHVDNLELYVGLQCEDIMPVSVGARFAAGYTMTRAVLADAINLVRGDRFSTTDFTPTNLTAWGYQDCQRQPNNGGFGGEMPKLLMRHLPRHYPYNSVYGCFPFFTPTTMRDQLTKQGIADQYSFERPQPLAVPVVLNDFTAINYVLADAQRFPSVYATHDTDLALALYPDVDGYRAWYRQIVGKLVKERSYRYDGVSGNFVDIVRGVINVAAVHWAADKLCGLPLKMPENPSGLYTEQEIYDMFTTLFSLEFLSLADNEHGFALRWAAFQSSGVLQALIAKSILEVAPKSAPNALVGFIGSVSKFLWSPSNKPWHPFLSKLAGTGRPMNELVAMVLGMAVATSVNYAHAAVNVIDFYLDDARASERANIAELVRRDDAESRDLLYGYIREAMRLNPQFPGAWRDVAADASIPQAGGASSVQVKAGDRIWASFRNAYLQPADFPNPTSVDPTRPKTVYNFGADFFQGQGQTFAEQTIVEVVKVVFSLKNVRRAPGDMGKIAGFTQTVNETETNVYLTPYGTTSGWPGEMVVQWDEDVATNGFH
ncbi:Heme peroxidase [Mycena kentingensis (nom. inval.)]|nr:Heme peroxidase [Mycena kentingensis (nom. inval.)]